MNEIWKPVVDYEGLYDVSNLGRVRSYYARGYQGAVCETPRVLRPGSLRGYRQVHLRRDGVGAQGLIHRLVAQAFLGAPPSAAHHVNHKDLNKANNVPENLEWVTQTQNNQHAAPLIPRNRGEANHSKLTEAQVIEIRRRHAANEANFASMAREFGVALQTISAIVKRKKWKHIA